MSKAFDWARWPIYARLRKPERLSQPNATNEYWVAYISAGGDHTAIACHGRTKDDALALRRHLLASLKQVAKEGKLYHV